jgi:hypothetical protein
MPLVLSMSRGLSGLDEGERQEPALSFPKGVALGLSGGGNSPGRPRVRGNV